MARTTSTAENKTTSPGKVSSVNKVIQQAKASLKLLETLEKQTIQRARTFVKNPLPKHRKRLTNEKILTSLRSLGIASRQEVRELAERVQKLEALVAAAPAQAPSTSTKKSRASKATDVFPN